MPHWRIPTTIFALSSLVVAFTACTRHDDSQTEPVIAAESKSQPYTDTDSLPGASPLQFNTAGPTNTVEREMPPIQRRELACQPLPWPEARKTANRVSRRATPSRRRSTRGGMAPSADLDGAMEVGSVAATEASVGKGAMPPSRSLAGKKSKAKVSSLSGGGRGPIAGEGTAPKRAGLLSAGEWRDLDHWSFWRKLFNGKVQGTSQWQDMQKLWGFSLRNRVTLTVKAGSELAPNVSVYLYDKDGKTAWKARSDNQGQVHLFPQWHKGPFSVCAAVTGAASKQVDIELSRGLAALDMGLQADSTVGTGLDVMFMVDTTGSMGDELSYLQAELRNVISRVQETNANADIRTSVNFYRDSSDEYIVRPFAFTREVKRARRQIAAQGANGGGDFPEAVDEALTNAIFEHKWREDARARILFLVLDAPPHQEKKTLARVRRAVRQAAEQGIRIVPIAGSGIDKPTEFLMRFLAVATGGTYAFLTDDSGIGNSHIKPTIGKHKVQKLNRLLAKIINRYAK